MKHNYSILRNMTFVLLSLTTEDRKLYNVECSLIL